MKLDLKNKINSAISRRQAIEQSLNRLRQQLEAENALIKMLQAQSMVLKMRPGNTTVRTGLDNLFGDTKEMNTTVIEPYSEFFANSWIGIDQQRGSNWITLGFSPAAQSEKQDSGENVEGARLSICPTITSPSLPRWVTIETEILEMPHATKSALRIEMISSFQFLDPQQSFESSTVELVLRGFNDDESYHDKSVGHAPVTTVPMLHTINFQGEGIEILSASHLKKRVLILFLPTHGDYIFHLFGLKMRLV